MGLYVCVYRGLYVWLTKSLGEMGIRDNIPIWTGVEGRGLHWLVLWWWLMRQMSLTKSLFQNSVARSLDPKNDNDTPFPSREIGLRRVDSLHIQTSTTSGGTMVKPSRTDPYFGVVSFPLSSLYVMTTVVNLWV